MNHRTRILRDVYKFHRKHGPGNYAPPHTFPSFVKDQAYLGALNQLLQESLILGLPSPPNSEGMQDDLVIALNPERFDKVRKELAAWYKDPRFLIPSVIAALALLWAIITVFWKRV